MSKRQTKVDKVIAAIEQEIAVLQLALTKLKQHQKTDKAATLAARDAAAGPKAK